MRDEEEGESWRRGRRGETGKWLDISEAIELQKGLITASNAHRTAQLLFEVCSSLGRPAERIPEEVRRKRKVALI